MRKPLADWAAIQAEYVQGRMTVAELAQTHDLKPDTVKKQAERNRWGAKRIEFQQKAAARAAEEAAVQRVTDLIAFNRDDLKVARAIRARISKRLEKEDDIPSLELRQLASSAEIAQRMGRLALGASTENIAQPAFASEPIGDDEGAPTMEEYLQARMRALEDF